jgi:hypothetical protein
LFLPVVVFRRAERAFLARRHACLQEAVGPLLYLCGSFGIIPVEPLADVGEGLPGRGRITPGLIF